MIARFLRRTAFFIPPSTSLPQGAGTSGKLILCVALCLLAAILPAAALASNPEKEPAPVVDMASWWVSEGEAASLAVIQRHVEARGLGWRQHVSPGSGTSRYWNVLEEWLAEGRPLSASQAIGFDIRDWASRGMLANLDAIAKEEEWDEVVPHGIQRLSKYKGHWVAVPINAHSTNWLWVNYPLFSRLGMPEPDTWDDLLKLLEKAKDEGIIPLAIGREPWEHTLLFECAAAGTGGAEFYRRAFLDLDEGALEQGLVEEIFRRMSVLRSFVDPEFNFRTWDEATTLLREGRALLQVQGSWVLGEFRHHGLKPGQEYSCLRFPDTQGMVLFNADQYFLFKNSPLSDEVRATLASALMGIEFQAELSTATGAAPARVDVPREGFDPCGRRSITDMRNANMRRTMMGSIAMGNANPAPVKEAIYAVVNEHFLGKLTDREAAHRLREVISAAAGADPES
ncbi:MAG: ABC transporter substrate-binding protein [Aminivibrio sp.]